MQDEYSPAALGIDVSALSGIASDSRKVRKGYLFAAIKGAGADGFDYIENAVKSGASVILSDREVSGFDKVHTVKTDNPRKALARVAAEFYGEVPEQIVAVTGTNGKSSVVHFIDQFWKSLGYHSAYLGTLSGAMTTPDAVALHEALSQMHREGIDHVALEASSHGLDQCRLDGLSPQVAAFTSFSQDHLDYHPDMESYLAAKSRLFSEILPINGTAVLNADSIAFAELDAVCKRRGIRVLSYGENGADIILKKRIADGMAQDIELCICGRDFTARLPLVGHFQLMNVLCAMGCVIAGHSEGAKITDALVSLLLVMEGVPGRLQYAGDGVRHAYVDYAHTPDALENVLEALRPHVEEGARLICVFGCGGDRDKSKRPLMGGIVSHLADVAIVTDDNPRSENPDTIRHEIIGGMRGDGAEIMNIGSRSSAIQAGAFMMKEKDILLVAGKGHEQGQEFNGVVKPFDDVFETRSAMLGDKVKSSAT